MKKKKTFHPPSVRASTAAAAASASSPPPALFFLAALSLLSASIPSASSPGRPLGALRGGLGATSNLAPRRGASE